MFGIDRRQPVLRTGAEIGDIHDLPLGDALSGGITGVTGNTDGAGDLRFEIFSGNDKQAAVGLQREDFRHLRFDAIGGELDGVFEQVDQSDPLGRGSADLAHQLALPDHAFDRDQYARPDRQFAQQAPGRYQPVHIASQVCLFIVNKFAAASCRNAAGLIQASPPQSIQQ
jgi:hypothetical protein